MQQPTTIATDVARALDEDLGGGDVTAALIDDSAVADAEIVCREAAVIAGMPWAEACFKSLDADAVVTWYRHDGDTVESDTCIGRIHGRARALVSAERTALNFLQLLSGTATTTAGYAAAVKGSNTGILDTRKTLPGLRQAQKYAVRCGGGHNHRMGLFDEILIKENHVAAAGGIELAINRARRASPGIPIVCEVESLDELAQAMAARADRVMLDEFSDAQLEKAVQQAGGRVPLEVSGSVDLDAVARLGRIGVDYISIGALTKHVRSIDLSMRFTTAGMNSC